MVQGKCMVDKTRGPDHASGIEWLWDQPQASITPWMAMCMGPMHIAPPSSPGSE